MSEKEKEIIETLVAAIPDMSEFDKCAWKIKRRSRLYAKCGSVRNGYRQQNSRCR